MGRWVQRGMVMALVAGLLGLPGRFTSGALLGMRQTTVGTAAAVNNSPVGNWKNTYAYCLTGWCNGQRFLNPTVITAYDPATGQFSGHDAGFPVTGSFHGTSLTMMIGGPGSGYTAHVVATITFSTQKATWLGTWTDNNNVGGTWSGTWGAADVTLSGMVTGQTCDATQCASAGFDGQLIVATGSDIDGAPVTKNARSDTSGDWSMTLPAGSYTVGPSTDGVTIDGAAFDPQETAVNATSGDVSHVDFVTCAGSAKATASLAFTDAYMASFPGSGVTRAALKDRASAAASGPGACPPDHIDWKMLGQTTDDVPHDAGATTLGLLPTRDIYQPLRAHLFFTRHGKQFDACSPKTVWKWTVTPLSPGAKVLSNLSSALVGCSVNVFVNKSGAYRVQANEFAPGKTQPLRKKPVQDDISPRNVLLAALGDSNGSGEGYPPFYFDQCHRGVASYQYQAAQLLEKQAKDHALVTFVSPSCSGARTQHLVDTAYEGITPGTSLQPQITQLAHQLARPTGGAARVPDATLISIGVNNIAFGPILEYCAIYTAKELMDGLHTLAQRLCEDTPVSSSGDGTGGVKAFTLNHKSNKTLGQAVDSLIAALPQRYNEVAAGLQRSHLVKPSTVYISQYPQFWFADARHFCGGPPVSPYFSKTWAWLGGEGDKLNAAVSAAAQQHGWHVITVPASSFYDHGYCSTLRSAWFVALSVSRFRNKAGAFHPTARGAHVTAVLALHLLCPLLGDKKRCTSFPAP